MLSPPSLLPSCRHPPSLIYQSRRRCLCALARYWSPPPGRLIFQREAMAWLMERRGEGRLLGGFWLTFSSSSQVKRCSCETRPAFPECTSAAAPLVPPRGRELRRSLFHLPEICFKEQVLTFSTSWALLSLSFLRRHTSVGVNWHFILKVLCVLCCCFSARVAVAASRSLRICSHPQQQTRAGWTTTLRPSFTPAS